VCGCVKRGEIQKGDGGVEKDYMGLEA